MVVLRFLPLPSELISILVISAMNFWRLSDSTFSVFSNHPQSFNVIQYIYIYVFNRFQAYLRVLAFKSLMPCLVFQKSFYLLKLKIYMTLTEGGEPGWTSNKLSP